MKIADHSTQGNSQSGNDLIPMINIIFLLLIFFMVAGRITNMSPHLKHPLSASDTDFIEGQLDITLLSTGEVLVNGKALSGDLIAMLRDLSIDEKTTIVCRVDRTLPATALDPVMQTVRELGVTKLHIVTELK